MEARVIVVDQGGAPIRVAVFGDDGVAVTVAVPVSRALSLARQLVEAAESRLRVVV